MDAAMSARMRSVAEVVPCGTGVASASEFSSFGNRAAPAETGCAAAVVSEGVSVWGRCGAAVGMEMSWVGEVGEGRPWARAVCELAGSSFGATGCAAAGGTGVVGLCGAGER